MKKILVYVTIVALFGATSCSDFLEEKVYDFYTPGNMYSTEDDAITAIAGVYQVFTDFNFMRSEFFQLIDLDQDHGCAEGWIINNGFADGNWQNTNTKFKNGWECLYKMIERANVVVENIPDITNCREAVKNQVLGEAHFLRAFCYFHLVRLWGRVPLRSVMFSPSNFEYSAPREEITTIYTLIIDDLKKAEELMVWKNDPILQSGRANKAAAKALLAKVYLYIAAASKQDVSIWVKVGWQPGVSGSSVSTQTVTNEVVLVNKTGNPFNVTAQMAGYENYNSEQYFQLAKEKAGELIILEGQTNGFRLCENFMDNFKGFGVNNEKNVENIWNLEPSGGNANTLYDYQQFMGYKGDQSSVTGFGRGYMLVGNSFYNSYKEEWYGAQYCMNNGVKELVELAGKTDASLGYYDIPSPNRHLRDERIELGFKHGYTRLNNNATDADYMKPRFWFFPQTEKNYYTLAECGAPDNDTWVSGDYQRSDSDTGCTTKYDWYSNVSGLRYTDASVSFLRYADVLLMYAEALNEVQGPVAYDELGHNAIYYLNKIRIRSRAIPIPEDGNVACYGDDSFNASFPFLNTREGFRSFVLEERGRELYYEMNRVFDMKRWGIYHSVMNRLDAIRQMNKARLPKHILFPIPIEERRANSAIGMSDDNNGW